jgi:hypothetical protein
MEIEWNNKLHYGELTGRVKRSHPVFQKLGADCGIRIRHNPLPDILTFLRK